MPKDNLKDKVDGNELDLSLNNLEVVPVKELAAVPKATILDLSCNLLVSLPDNFCSLTHLVKLDLSKNKLTELPHDFGKLENLHHLDLLGNQLTDLPESFSRLRKLKWLDLKDNPLVPGLKKNAGDCLDEKQCRICAQRILLYMKELSSEMERQRQKKLKEQRDKEAKVKAQEEEVAKKKKDLKKAEKERRKQEAQQRKSAKKETGQSTDDDLQGAGEAVRAEKQASRKDKTGRGFCTCCMMMLSIFAVLVALVIGIAFHCSANLKDRYCQAYYNPLQAQVTKATATTQKHAKELYSAASNTSLHLYRVAADNVAVWYLAGREVAHKAYVSAMQVVEGDAGDGGKQGMKT